MGFVADNNYSSSIFESKTAVNASELAKYVIKKKKEKDDNLVVEYKVGATIQNLIKANTVYVQCFLLKTAIV